MDFKEAHPTYERNPRVSDPPLMQAYQDDINTYQQSPYLYHIGEEASSTFLCIFNIETKRKIFKDLKNCMRLREGTCIAQLPNSKLFCLGRSSYRDLMIIDENFEIEELQSRIPCFFATCIYFNNSVYCFGGENDKYQIMNLSGRFDLCQHRWSQLIPMPKPDYECTSVIFNRNILISGFYNTNLLLYSIDINSFTTIPYQFAKNKRKILINAERLYLIECSAGSIYESDPRSEYAWRRVAKSIIRVRFHHEFCSYYKGAIHIGLDYSWYFKFDLNGKKMIEM